MVWHDFRRTAAHNLERAGVPRSVAMKISDGGLSARQDHVGRGSAEAAARLGTFLGHPRVFGLKPSP
jgi:hypothetical protein